MNKTIELVKKTVTSGRLNEFTFIDSSEILKVLESIERSQEMTMRRRGWEVAMGHGLTVFEKVFKHKMYLWTVRLNCIKGSKKGLIRLVISSNAGLLDVYVCGEEITINKELQHGQC